nr:HsmA family protein [uncultured Cellulosilyticum sp.]
MNSTLIIAIVAITLALVFYTIGVFAERKSGTLKSWHVIIFWLGLICDTTGTYYMSLIAKANTGGGSGLHGITGLIAIILMLFHALWATWVLYKNDNKRKQSFHKFSIIVWLIWLIPYFIGMYIGMMG